MKPGGGEISRRLYETAAVATLRDRLKSGDVWVEGSRAYRRFGDYLLPKDQVAAEARGLPVNVELGGYLAGRANLLDQRLASFARRLRRGDLAGVTLEGDRLSVTPVKASTQEEARSLDRAIDGLLPRVRITELLREIDALTGFTAMSGTCVPARSTTIQAAYWRPFSPTPQTGASSAWPTPARA